MVIDNINIPAYLLTIIHGINNIELE